MKTPDELRPGVRVNFLVRRRLLLTPNVPLERTVCDDLIGFNRLWPLNGDCWLEYDASRVHIDQLLERLAQVGCVPVYSFLNRFRLGWYRYQDSNIAANARDESTTSCAKSPLKNR